jgi:hypothetical protein
LIDIGIFISVPYLCYKWGTASVSWNMANWTWGECQLIQELINEVETGGVPGEVALPPWLREEEKPYNPYQTDRRDRFIRLMCKVKGYKEYDEKKKIHDDIKVTAADVALVIKTVSGIDITTRKE